MAKSRKKLIGKMVRKLRKKTGKKLWKNGKEDSKINENNGNKLTRK